MQRFLDSILSASLVLALSACVIAPDAPVTTPDGLVKRRDSRVDSVYAAPGASLARYRRVWLDTVEVSFKQDWQARNPGVSADEVAMIRHGATSIFRGEFAAELQKGGYTLAQAAGDDVLRVSASIVDLDFVTSGAAAAGYLVTASDMSLLADLRDSQSGAMLARVADRSRGRNVGNLQVADQATYSAEARAAITHWATLLRESLDAARQPPKP